MHTHTLQVTRRGFTCTRCGEYFSTAELATAKPCNERDAAEKADDIEADAEHAVTAKNRQPRATKAKKPAKAH